MIATKRSSTTEPWPRTLRVRDGLLAEYPDVLGATALAAVEALAPFNAEQQRLMASRIARRTRRSAAREPIGFLHPESVIPGTTIMVRDARAGRFAGPEIPSDLRRQWVQGTGPGAKPNAPLDSSLRTRAL